jgi:CotH kinase protein/Lamin Tail Domain/Secretion system C-terminal sorting domain
MKKQYFFKIFLLLFTSFASYSQTFTDSNLPIVVITTDNDPISGNPLEIIDEPKILASMKIIKRPDGSRNYLTDANTALFLNYNGRIGIELRGSSSQELPKKPYGLTTLKADNISNNNVSILGMPAENDWVLNALAFDASLIRDYISYNMARQMGNYATRTEYCEVVINGEYKGLYVFQEKVKASENRVNIQKITATDITEPNITGGYIIEANRPDAGTLPTWVMEETNFNTVLPKPENIKPEQKTYINGEFNRLKNNVYNYSPQDGYTSVIDVPSFVDFIMVNELASNADVYQFSTYFHKDKGGKLRAGPVWDLNLTFANTFTGSSDVDQWQFSNGNKTGPWFWNGLMENSTFPCYFSKRWHEMIAPGMPLNETVLTNYIDNTLSYISEAIPREQAKWGTLTNHLTDIATIKTFITNRIAWITANVGSYTACENVITPPLVITKINYNPATSTEFAVSNDLEFIEITNAGSETVDLSGVYFRELGTSYLFPPNATIGGNQSLYLTSNMATFQAKYGFTAFGQYSRNLSNKSQKIVLADAYGNTIDSVEYFDTWFPQTDGAGSYLQLTDTALDNNLATSWQDSNVTTLSNNHFVSLSALSIYPNPMTNNLTIESNNAMDRITIFNSLGVLIQDIKEKSTTINTDLSAYSEGVYFITVYDQNGLTTKKIMKM